MENQELSYSQRLRDEIKRAGYTQDEFAQLVKIDKVTLNIYITGARSPNIFVAQKIALALKKNVDYFLKTETDVNKNQLGLQETGEGLKIGGQKVAEAQPPGAETLQAKIIRLESQVSQLREDYDKLLNKVAARAPEPVLPGLSGGVGDPANENNPN